MKKSLIVLLLFSFFVFMGISLVKAAPSRSAVVPAGVPVASPIDPGTVALPEPPSGPTAEEAACCTCMAATNPLPCAPLQVSMGVVCTASDNKRCGTSLESGHPLSVSCCFPETVTVPQQPTSCSKTQLTQIPNQVCVAEGYPPTHKCYGVSASVPYTPRGPQDKLFKCDNEGAVCASGTCTQTYGTASCEFINPNYPDMNIKCSGKTEKAIEKDCVCKP